MPRWWSEEDPDIDSTLSVCNVVGCGREIRHLGLCSTHYSRKNKFGRTGPLLTKRMKPEWHSDSNGYICKFVNGRKVYQHREVMAGFIGRPLYAWENVHHKNGIRSDNTLSNLELWAKPQYAGQRVEDMADFLIENYRTLVLSKLGER